jgi:enolase
MPIPTITDLRAIEILDSRGRPTVSVSIRLDDGATATAGVPSGASTGSREAVEIRDGDSARFGGLGVLRAVASVNETLAPAMLGRSFSSSEELDSELISIDGTPTKSHLGANAIVGVSMAFARALATSAGRPLWQTLSPQVEPRLPVPHFNVVNGGAHAPNVLDFQEFMLAPLGASTLPDAVRAGAEVYSRLRALLLQRGLSAGLGDEGGFAPELTRAEDVLALLVEAITAAGYEPGVDGVAIALDPAASEFYRDGTYLLAGQKLSSAEMVDYYGELVSAFPIWSIEDGLAEDDWDGWRQLTSTLGDRVQLMGDDIFVTDAATIEIVEMVLAGSINKTLVGYINEAGGKAVGLCGKDGNMVTASKVTRTMVDPGSHIEKVVDLGFVGEPEKVDLTLLNQLIGHDLIPVLAPLATSRTGQTFNVNADTFAGAVAGALKAKRLLLLTDVPGVLDKSKKLIPELSVKDARKLIADGTISGGMIPKVETCIYALEQGVQGVVIIDGKTPHAVLLELFTNQGTGTLIHK